MVNEVIFADVSRLLVNGAEVEGVTTFNSSISSQSVPVYNYTSAIPVYVGHMLSIGQASFSYVASGATSSLRNWSTDLSGVGKTVEVSGNSYPGLAPTPQNLVMNNCTLAGRTASMNVRGEMIVTVSFSFTKDAPAASLTDIVIGGVSLLVNPDDISVSYNNEFNIDRSATGKKFVTFYDADRFDRSINISGGMLPIALTDTLLNYVRTREKITVKGTGSIAGSFVVLDASRSPTSPRIPYVDGGGIVGGVLASYNIAMKEFH